jgi:hypothetical protein
MSFDDSPGMNPMPNLERLEALDACFAWCREQAKKKGFIREVRSLI